jgi:crotonobetainyl-CoA:carnitine CoA-transferase CaiB-like acyl-CoA transferase
LSDLRVVDHPPLGPVGMAGISYKLGNTPAEIRRHPPLLGEHTDQVLSELGQDGMGHATAGARRLHPRSPSVRVYKSNLAVQ